jgi:hypothetical protein
VIGEDRTLVANTPYGTTWGHLQAKSNETNPDPPKIGQRIGQLEDMVFADPDRSKLWTHFIASRRLNENTTINATAYLYAVPAGAADWTAGALVDSAVLATELANLDDGDPGSVAEGALMMDLDNAAARAAHPGGDYWIVLANTISPAGSSCQLHIDQVTAEVADANDPGSLLPPAPSVEPADKVAGDLIMFTDNGGWCWYQDERTIVDRDNGSILFTSVANYLGYGGEPRDGDIDVTTFIPASGTRQRVTMATIPTLNKGDDHSAASLWQRPDGRYYAGYTGHNYGAGYNGGETEPITFFRMTTSPNDGAAWNSQTSFTWPENGTDEDDVSYTNLLYMSAEGAGQGRLYNIARADDRTPAISCSDDLGATWRYGGRLSNSTTGSSYSNGYFVFTSNGVDRIDFMCTEHHPRDYNNSIYHGYIQGGKSYDSFGNVIDEDIFDETAPAPQEFTPVWLTDTTITDTSCHHAWTMELELGPDGRLYGLFLTRHGTTKSTERIGDADHRLFYAWFDGGTWITHEVCKMGNSLDGREGDYTGLGSIDPNDPSLIYVSAEHDPRDGTPLPKHEIFKGVTSDGGASWTWTPVTRDSTVENFRPIIPKWDADHLAVLWLRGRYPFQRDYDQTVVGLVLNNDEEAGEVTYFDADTANTTLANGSPLTTTGPSPSAGAADDQWHVDSGFGNNDTAYTANEIGAEDAPAIRTTVSGLADGTYDVWAYFWSRPGDDWRIRAGFATSDLLVFRRYSCQQAETSRFDGTVTVLDTERALYRAYVGRRTVANGSVIDVYIDDFDGAASPGSQRTAYDGVGVARVLPVLNIAAGQGTTISSDSGPYASIRNQGSLIVKGAANLEVAGEFVNDGFLDLLTSTGALPAGFVNNGTVLDASNAQTNPKISLQGSGAVVEVGGYAGHTYQLQTSDTLQSADWQNLGAPVAGTGPNGVPDPLQLTDPDAGGRVRKFYRVVIE